MYKKSSKIIAFVGAAISVIALIIYAIYFFTSKTFEAPDKNNYFLGQVDDNLQEKSQILAFVGLIITLFAISVPAISLAVEWKGKTRSEKKLLSKKEFMLTMVAPLMLLIGFVWTIILVSKLNSLDNSSDNLPPKAIWVYLSSLVLAIGLITNIVAIIKAALKKSPLIGQAHKQDEF